MQCKELEIVLGSEGLGPLPAEAREHLAGCTACQDYLADLSAIVVAAKTIPAEVAPPDRIWISLRAQLEAEGLIKEPIVAEERSSWRENFSAWLRPRALATATAFAALLALGVFVNHALNTNQPKVAQNPPGVKSEPPPQAVAPASEIPKAPLSARVAAPVTVHPKSKELAPSPSELASTTLAQAELDVSDMQLAGNSQVDASLRNNLRTLNEFIAECQQHLKQNPQDELAREYLNAAYQQKADLLAAMMDSGRSEH
jgi:hypothetical protein